MTLPVYRVTSNGCLQIKEGDDFFTIPKPKKTVVKSASKVNGAQKRSLEEFPERATPIQDRKISAVDLTCKETDL